MARRSILSRRPGAPIAALIFVIYAYFIGGYVNNVMNNAIADLAIAIVDDHSIQIDPYAGNSNDVAEREHHMYSGFGPGLSFMLVPVYALIDPVISVLPKRLLARTDSILIRSISGRSSLGESRSRTNVLLLIVAGTLVFAIPFAVVSLGQFIRVCRRFFPRLSDEDLLAFGLLFSFGTLVMAFATNISHTSIAAFLIWFAVSDTILANERRFVRSMGIGGLLGLAPTVDYPAAVFAAYAVAFILLWIPARRRFRTGLALTLGGIPPVLVCGWYHWAAFGSAFTNSYRFRVRSDDQAVFSLAHLAQSLPSSAKLFVAFLHPYSGTLIYHPLMLLAGALSVWLVVRDKSDVKLFWIFVVATIMTNLLLYCSYPLSTGPASGPEFMIRYTIYSAPFAVLALAATLDRIGHRRVLRKALWSVALVNAIPVWAFALYGCPVFPSRGYAALMAEIGPANYTLTKLHEAHILNSPLWGWVGFAFVLCMFYWLWRVSGAVVARRFLDLWAPGEPAMQPPERPAV